MADLIAVAILVFMGVQGWRRGAKSMLLMAGTLIAAYGAAFLLFRPLGSLLLRLFSMPPLLAYPLGGMVAFLAVAAAGQAFARRHGRERRERLADGWKPPSSDCASGAALGVVYGLGVVLVLGWAANSFAGLSNRAPSIERSAVATVSSGVAERVVRTMAQRATGDAFLASGTAMMLADPGEGLAVVNSLVGDPRVQELMGDRSVYEDLTGGSPGSLAQNLHVRALASDPEFVSAIRRIGLLEGRGEGGGTVPPEELSAALVEGVGPLLRAVEVLGQDPEILEMARSPEVREALERGDFLRLASDGRTTDLFKRVLEEVRRQQR